MPADPRELRAARAGVARLLLAQGVEPAVIDDVVLAVSEVLTNAVQASPPDGVIELRVDCGRERVRVEVRNSGDAIDVDLVDADLPPLAQVGGRGIPVVRAVTDELEARHDAPGTTTVAFSRRRRAAR